MRRSSRRSTMAVSLHQSLDNESFSRISTRRSSSIVPQFDDSRTSVGNFMTKFSMSSFINKVKKLTSDQRSAIERVGFGNLLQIPLHTLKKNLLIELMERWDCERRAFLLLDQELSITPIDVALILGLPACGKPVNFSENEPFSNLDKEYEAANGSRKISVSSIEKRLVSLGDSADEDFVRTFLLFTFGTLLFHNSTGKVDSRYLSLLQDLTKVAAYAWGLAVIEDLFSWLSRRKEEGINNMEGCLVLLQIWSYEHVDIGRPNLLSGSLTFPRACRWESIKSNTPRLWFATKFNELEENQVLGKLEPLEVELNVDVVKELLVAETKSNEVKRERLNETTKTTKRTSTVTECKGLPPKAYSQLPPTGVMKEQVRGTDKHDAQAECPESSCLSIDASDLTANCAECSSSYYAQEELEDQMPETSLNFREEYHISKIEISELKKMITELRSENDTLRNQLSSYSKTEDLMEDMRNENADLKNEIAVVKKENESLRFAADFYDEIVRIIPEPFDT